MSILTVLVAGVLDPGPAVVATTIITSALILIFGGIVPKAVGARQRRVVGADRRPAGQRR